MPDIRHNTASHRYELEIDDHVAKAWYRKQGNVVTFTHTDVPDELSGKGVGTRLVQGALDATRAAGNKVIALCPFVAAYIRRHGDYADLLAEPIPDRQSDDKDS